MSQPASLPERPNPRAASVAKNIVAGYGGYAVALGIGMFLSPYIVHRLGNTLYGIWTLIVSLTGYLGLLDMGVRGAVTRYIARFHAQEKNEDASRMASTAIALFAIGGLIAIVISVVLAFVAVERFQIPQEMHVAARVVAVLAGLTVATSLLGGVFGGILVGLQRLDLTNGVEIASAILRAATIVVALHGGKGIVTLGLIQLIFSVLTALANLRVSLWLYPELQLGLSKVSREYFQLIFSFGIYSFLLHIFAYLVLYTDAVVIAAFLPIGMVTYFAIAGNLVTYARQSAGAITTSMTPLASQMEARGQHRELQDETVKWTRYTTTLILAIGITFIIRGQTFIGLWMGPSYAEISAKVLTILTIGAIVGVGASVPWAVTFGLGKHKSIVPLFLVEALANLGLSIVLVRPMGIVGVAWGTAIPEVLLLGLFWPAFVHKITQIPPWRFVRSAWLTPLVALLPFAAVSYAIERVWSPHGLLMFFAQVGVALTAAFGGFWFLCVSGRDRSSIVQALRSRLSGG